MSILVFQIIHVAGYLSAMQVFTANKAIKFAPYGRRTLASSHRLWRRYPKGVVVEITEENELEKILRLVADEPAHRPQFCEVLLSSQVFLLGTTGMPGIDGEVNLEAGSKIQIQHWEKADGSPRSEERRVGKECRCRGST